jgi:hypothetical protein
VKLRGVGVQCGVWQQTERECCGSERYWPCGSGSGGRQCECCDSERYWPCGSGSGSRHSVSVVRVSGTGHVAVAVAADIA